jgi:HD superfamily phosphohydrolase
MSEMRARKPRIYDAVYGYVELEMDEFNLVNTAIFQRLHWIKQLGPLHTVFPSAQHSRFSHSIGVFYSTEVCRIAPRHWTRAAIAYWRASPSARHGGTRRRG